VTARTAYNIRKIATRVIGLVEGSDVKHVHSTVRITSGEQSGLELTLEDGQ